MRAMLSFLLAFFLVLLLSTDLHSAEVEGSSSTYLVLRESVSGMDISPLYEYIDLNVEKILGRDISLHASGWVRGDLGDEWADDKYDDELAYAYVRFGLARGMFINLGRTHVFEGVASEQIDGLYGKATLPMGLGFAVYGGMRVELEDDYGDQDHIYGARLFHKVQDTYTLGISFLKENGEDGGNFREESGIDIWFRLSDIAEIQGVSTYNSLSDGWMEHSYYLTLLPGDKLYINLEYSLVDYEDFFFNPEFSAFSPVQLEPGEEVQATGGNADFTFARFAAFLEYKNYRYDIMGNADFYGGGIKYAGEGYAAGISVHRMYGQTDRLRY